MQRSLKYVIAGGSGHLGSLLKQGLQQAGHQVRILARRPGPDTAVWDGATPGSWFAELDGADVLINMAGRSVNCRYDARHRREILDSRLRSTRVLGEAIAAAARPPATWLQSSTATIYAHRFDAPNDDATGILGGHEPNLPDTWKFSYEVARRWEEECLSAPTPHTRKALLRTAIAMSPERGGPFNVLLWLVRLGLGGTMGSGRQFISWIHGQDFLNACQWIVDHPELEGPINLAAPGPLPNRTFMATLRRAWGMPFGLPATPWMLELGAFLMRSETELILKSRCVVSSALQASGFQFRFSDWNEAARDLCARSR